jgi:methylenetetrahydrofolate reductase (NADPH)
MIDPRIDELLASRARPLLSYEFFPPRDRDAWDRFVRCVETMRPSLPDFTTVTYGAGGSTRDRSIEACRFLREQTGVPAMAHLTCVGSTREALTDLAGRMHAEGIRNIMALRGDPPRRAPRPPPSEGHPVYASDLVSLLSDFREDFCIGVAGYPETHSEAPTPEADLIHLKLKLAAGASFVTTQLFFDNAVYFDFVERCRKAGIYHPVIPGILPAVSLPQARRIASMCGISLPPRLEVALLDAGEQGPAAEAVGLQWAARQIEELLGAGAPGIHLYILNRSRTALAPTITRCFAGVRETAAV